MARTDPMRDSTSATRRHSVFRLLPAALLIFATGCDMAKDDGGKTAAVSAEEANWKIVEAYIELDAAWHRRDSEIGWSDAPADEKDRPRKEERGEHPDIMLAVAAAKAIIDDEGERALDAAKFLVEQPTGLSPTAANDIAFGNAALARLIGPDWSVVEAFHEAMQAWRDDDAARREAFKSQSEDSTPQEGGMQPAAAVFVFVPTPKALEATAAAQAILDAGADHEKARDAAEFLVEHGMQSPQALIKGARVLVENFPDFDDWPNVLMRLSTARPGEESRPFDDHLAEMASDADDPVVRATARYFLANALAERANQPSMDTGERQANRRQALEMAIGMSTGVEAEEFVKKTLVDGEQVARTLAEAEASLVHGIRHTLVGSTVADETAKRLDGTEDSLSAYAGKVVLMDFWATWCGPCIAALPELRDLADAHPGEGFEILGISVDAELETVTEFMEDKPMPWAHWHIGVGSDLGLSWNITGYPTYVVVDENGVILSRGHDLDVAIKVIGQAIDDAPATT